jgi:hypothetical protein
VKGSGTFKPWDPWDIFLSCPGGALGKPEPPGDLPRCDGSLLMHMGALPIIGSLKPKNLLHVLLNNASHESGAGNRRWGLH